MRRLALAVFALILLVLAALGGGVGILFWQPQRLVPPLTAWLARRHIAAHFEGPLSLTFAPSPKLGANGVTLEWEGIRLKARTLSARIALRPLLRGRMVLVRLDLDGVDFGPADLLPTLSTLDERTEGGEGGPGRAASSVPSAASIPPSPPAPPAGRTSSLRLILREVSLHEGRLVLGGAPFEIERLDIGPPRRHDWRAPRQVELDARYQNIAFSLSAIATPGGRRLELRSGRLSAPEGSIAFDLTAEPAPLPRLAGSIAIHRLDLDALRHALPRRPRPAPLPPSQAASPPAAPSAPAPSAAPPPLPFAALNRAAADLELSADEIIESGASYHDLSAHLRLGGGTLTLDALHGIVPGGEVSGTASARASPPAIALTLNAPGLALAPLIAAFHWPEAGTSGEAAVKLTLAAEGDTPEAWRNTLHGAAGVAVVDAAVGNAVLLRGLESLLPPGSLPLFALKAKGTSAVRCLALRLDAEAGVLHFTAARLETSRLLAAAGGTVALGPRRLDLTLVPALAVAREWVIVPFRIGGTLDKPLWQPDPEAADADLLRKEDCAEALAAARFGAAGPLPTTPPPETPRHKANLRGLLDSLIK